MTECCLERQAAIFCALTDKSLKKKYQTSDISVTLSHNAVKVAEKVAEVLKPLKMVITLLSTENDLIIHVPRC